MNERVANQLSMRSQLLGDPRVSEFGFVSRVVGLTIETQGVKAALGSICEIERESGPPIEAQVVGRPPAPQLVVLTHARSHK